MKFNIAKKLLAGVIAWALIFSSAHAITMTFNFEAEQSSVDMPLPGSIAETASQFSTITGSVTVVPGVIPGETMIQFFIDQLSIDVTFSSINIINNGSAQQVAGIASLPDDGAAGFTFLDVAPLDAGLLSPTGELAPLDQIVLSELVSRGIAFFSDSGDDAASFVDFDFTSFSVPTNEVPLPAAAWVFLAGLGGLRAMRRKGSAHNA